MGSNLVIQLARFGDIVQTGRLIHALVRDGDTHLCLDHALVPLAKKLYPKCTLHPIHAHGKASTHEVFEQNCATFTALRDIPFQAVFNLNYAGMNRALAYLFPPEILFGYTMCDKQHHRETWFRLAFRWMAKRRMAPLNLTDFWGLLAPNPLPPQDVHPKAKGKGGGLGIVLAGRNSRRSLPPEILATCVMALFERLDAPTITLFGTQQERLLANQLLRALRKPMTDKVVDLTAKTNFDGLIENMGSLDLVFTPDTGSMHLATALGVPVEAYFLSSAWAHETGPYGLGHHVWQSRPPCAPCNEYRACEHERACLANFSDHGFLNQLMGHDARALPDSLQKLATDFDELGLVFRDTNEVKPCDNADMPKNIDSTMDRDMSDSMQRLQTRNLLASIAPSPVWLGSSSSSITQHLIHESDWILPNTRP